MSSKSFDILKTIKHLTKSTDDAFYCICNLSDIYEKYKMWTSVFPDIKPYYAVKCNDDLTALKLLASLGIGFDCASKLEIKKILSLNVDPNKIIYANPNKFIADLQYAVNEEVSLMTFDNECELYKIQKIYPRARLVLRIKSEAIRANYPMGNKFGCDPIEEAPQLLKLAKALNLNVIGISFHVGSGCQEPAAYGRAIANARKVYDYAQTLGYNLSILDIGGGYPGATGTSIVEIADIVKRALNAYFKDVDIQVIAEPGTFFVQSAYTLACNIYALKTLTRKEIDGTKVPHRMYFINDGIFGSFNCVMSYQEEVYPITLDEYPHSKQVSSSIWGPTCDGLDRVVKEISLPEMAIGDWFVFENMGAYTIPLITSFNGFSKPKIYYVIDQNIRSSVKNSDLSIINVCGIEIINEGDTSALRGFLKLYHSII
ncbi:hypothetical protein ABEB36_007246 [Hypothenemus hampei]|uniref:Orn/DAP/Arg decarboxylase 2 N-terminal domain-containing protein n=1 Tax=Hypothenemus hampei TaxID=57062 RepID=A0ABD1EXA3_HYPHA